MLSGIFSLQYKTEEMKRLLKLKRMHAITQKVKKQALQGDSINLYEKAKEANSKRLQQCLDALAGIGQNVQSTAMLTE